MKSKIVSVFQSYLLLLSTCYSAYAQTTPWAVCGVGKENAAMSPLSKDLSALMGNILKHPITIIGIAAFVMFLIGSFRYLTAGANSKGVESGKNAISFAILGIVVALASFLICALSHNHWRDVDLAI